MKKKLNLKIYEKNINNKFKSIDLNLKKNDVGKIKYLPPYFKEWKNIAYFYNKDFIKNLPINNLLINKLIKSYFNLLFLKYKYIVPKKKRVFLNDIYISKAETKYTNSTAIITLYTVNIRKYLFNKYLNYFYYYSILKEIEMDKNNLLIRKKPYALFKLLKIKFLRFIGIETIIHNNNNKYLSNNLNKSQNPINILNILNYKFEYLNKNIKLYNLYKKIYLIKEIKYIYYQYLITLYKYNYQLFFYNFKFKEGNNSFLAKLKFKLSILLNKKIELNIINLKSIAYNTDIFTQALANKLKKKRFNVIKSMITILNKGKILQKNIPNDGISIKKRDLNLLDNKFKNFSLLSILKRQDNLNSLLNILFFKKEFRLKNYNNIKNIYKIIFDLIKYKNMAGIRLEVKGRLTKRYRADRALYKLNWKGGLKNIDSSSNKLSSVIYRGNFNSNVSYSITKSKRRIGSFAVKGWISGK